MESSRNPPPRGETPPAPGGPAKRYPFFRAGDILLAAAIVIAAILFAVGGGEPGRASRVTVGSPSGRMESGLGIDSSFIVDGLLGPVRIEIRGDSARIVESPCPGQQCVRAGWMSMAGEMSVCAPSGVWLRMDGDSPAQPDAISY